MKPKKSWVALNIVLLAIYLLFFHLCLGASATTCIYLGIGLSTLTLTICILCKKSFKNSYEFIFYTFLALDILLEGFIPLHEGYSFYYCALAFWSVFLTYHFTGTGKFKCLCSGRSKKA